jgi:hypothetical protein
MALSALVPADLIGGHFLSDLCLPRSRPASGTASIHKTVSPPSWSASAEHGGVQANSSSGADQDIPGLIDFGSQVIGSTVVRM